MSLLEDLGNSLFGFGQSQQEEARLTQEMDNLLQGWAKAQLGRGDYWWTTPYGWSQLGSNLPIPRETLQKHLLQELSRRDGELRIGKGPDAPYRNQLESLHEQFRNAPNRESTVDRMERGLLPIYYQWDPRIKGAL